MLLFIAGAYQKQEHIRVFQYISCYCLSRRRKDNGEHEFISIHLMLLFILVLPQGSPFVLHFNTSHVTVYHGAQSNIVSIHADFNTSHVTVYRLFNIFSIASSSFQYISCYCLSSIGVSFRKSSVEFQYISCYCLSTNQNVLFAETRDFNTSHVTVYLPANTPSSYLSSFQYISCYCLSVNSFCCVAVNLVFQYISCYCLSKGYEIVNTLFTEFQYISCYCLSAIQMRRGLLADLFQYISCYCLSPR